MKRRMVCFLLFYRLVIEQGMGCLVNVLSSVCVVHGVEMHACYVLRYQVHDLVYGIGKSCCSERLRVMLILVQDSLKLTWEMDILTSLQETKSLVTIEDWHDPCMNRNINPCQGTLVLEIVEALIVKEKVALRGWNSLHPLSS